MKLFKLFVIIMFASLPALSQNISRMEYFIDEDPGYGNGVTIPFSGTAIAEADFTVPLGALDNGLHLLFLRAQNQDGDWSITSVHHIFKAVFQSPEEEIAELEYFFDTDPGPGNGTSVPVSPGASVDVAFQADMSGLSPGMHFLYARARSTDGVWGNLHQHPVLVDVIETSLTDITDVEYFIDDDPGFGNAIPVAVTPSTLQEVAFGVDVAGIDPGIHFITVRAKTDNDVWSHCYTSLFMVDVLQFQPENIMEVEYFIDEDPGVGNAQSVPITPSQVIDLDFLVDPGTINPGIHFLCVRAKDEDGIWSMSYVQPFMYDFMQAQNNLNIEYVEYFVDTDPGFGNATSVPVTPSSVVELDFNIQPTDLESGMHFLHIRGRDQDGIWSLTETHAFLYNFMQSQENRAITYFEYFVDDDPGYGNAMPVDVTAGPIVELDFVADLNAMEPGIHFLVLRGQDEDGVWSLCNVHPFFTGGWGEEANITQLEYFFDEDPGYGTGNIVDIDPAAKVVSLDFNMNLAGIPEGQHLVYTRAKDENGAWSSTMIDTLEVLPPLGEYALQFDGMDDFLEAGDVWFPADDLTIEAWIKPEETGETQEIVFWSGENSTVQFRVNGNGSLLYGESVSGSWNFVLSGPGQILPGRWTHVAISKGGDQCNLYVNGTHVGYGEFDENPVTSVLNIGGRAPNMDRFFNGQIDEVRIWETARTQQEIRDNLCGNFTGTEPGIFGRWNFNDGPGSAVASDSGPNGFGAWLYNMQPQTGPDCSWIEHECQLPPSIDLAVRSIISPRTLVWNRQGTSVEVIIELMNHGMDDFNGEITLAYEPGGSP